MLVGGRYEVQNRGKWEDDELVAGANHEEFTFVNKIYTWQQWLDPNQTNWNPIRTESQNSWTKVYSKHWAKLNLNIFQWNYFSLQEKLVWPKIKWPEIDPT